MWPTEVLKSWACQSQPGSLQIAGACSAEDATAVCADGFLSPDWASLWVNSF
jgi:hypothetical protein